ncbi:MAG TPA: hypothetical protein VGZ24_10105 [Chthoniobacterales bacterium]|jgi:hypothetical protein|nr:hypothetical protein [Chthoniobacterales bacterium]
MKNAQRFRLAEIASEVTTKGYFARVQQRAARRKSPWNLLDVPVGLTCIALVGGASLHIVWAARNAVLPKHAEPLLALLQSESYPIAPIVLIMGILFLCIPIGMLISNVIVWSIPPYRRAIEPEAKGVWHASFLDSQNDLSLLALCIGLPALGASFVAALIMR